MMLKNEHIVKLRAPHNKQELIKNSKAKRKIIRAGRRGGKTVIAAQIAVEKFLEGRRILYAAPTAEQVGTFWFEVKRALDDPVNAGLYVKNESEKYIELTGTKQRIRAKTAWNADTLRGDYADLLILDEYQLMNEEAWEVVGQPMLLDNNGDAIFIYTPPSLHSRSVTKAMDPKHAAKLFKKAQEDKTGLWEAFHFTSLDNPHVSSDALDILKGDMTNIAYRQEILAEDIDEIPGALWTRKVIQHVKESPKLVRIVIGVDPPGGGTECGIVAAGRAVNTLQYVLKDRSIKASPGIWADAVIDLYVELKADCIVAEINYGGDMVKHTIEQAAIGRNVPVRIKVNQATRGKAQRAEPVVAQYEQGRIMHVGDFPELEDEMTGWVPGESQLSPNRVDALVWACNELMINSTTNKGEVIDC